MHTSLALVHHANQYLITNGYDNREGIKAVLGGPGEERGLAQVLALHARYGVPLNLHMSGTLLEAIAWHQPEFLQSLRTLLASGLIELVGSCYGQNIMRFFGPDYNRAQLNEELDLYATHLQADSAQVRVFWPPERVWDTHRMAPVLRDSRLRNGGYDFVILDDRLLLSPHDPEMPRGHYDENGHFRTDLYQMHAIEGGMGLMAFPIGTRLRRSIPPQKQEDWAQVQSELEGLLIDTGQQEAGADLLAVFADDMEKIAGIGEWGGDGPARYEKFLQWLSSNQTWIKPVRLTEWARASRPGDGRAVETGTFSELAREFQAGEGYEKWYLAPDWALYRSYFAWTEQRVTELAEQGADEALLNLARKQLLVSNWETAWHTPATGPHGDPDQHGHASPWARALTSHCRHAAVTAEAAHWRTRRLGVLAEQRDIDHDGIPEVVLANEHLFAVISPRWGGRLVALFSAGGPRGAQVVGNPCDDWNWQEELNRYMDVPRNHPGAFADIGAEHDRYEVTALTAEPPGVCLRLRNVEPKSRWQGLVKEYRLPLGAASLQVRYELPRGRKEIEVECGFSPDYLTLLREGSAALRPVSQPEAWGCATADVAISLRAPQTKKGSARESLFGHGCAVRLKWRGPVAEASLDVEWPTTPDAPARGVTRALEVV